MPIHSHYPAEDIIGVDDIQLLSANGENALENSPAIIGLTPLAPAKSGNNNNQQHKVLASVDSSADSAAIRSPKNPFEGLLADDESPLLLQNNNKDKGEQQEGEQEGEQRTRIFAVPSDDNANNRRQNSNDKNKKKARDFAASSSPAEAKPQQPQQQQQPQHQQPLIRPQIRLSPSLQLDDGQQQQMAAAMLGGSR
jgi:hypothetical protein